MISLKWKQVAWMNENDWNFSQKITINDLKMVTTKNKQTFSCDMTSWLARKRQRETKASQAHCTSTFNPKFQVVSYLSLRSQMSGWLVHVFLMNRLNSYLSLSLWCNGATFMSIQWKTDLRGRNKDAKNINHGAGRGMSLCPSKSNQTKPNVIGGPASDQSVVAR